MLRERMDSLKRDLVEYAAMVQSMIERSIKGLIDRERDLLVEVIEKYEPRVNAFEIMLEEKCTVLIAQFQPRARDLRTILMIYQMNNDLERIGDHAENIAESGLFLIERPPVKQLIDIPKMAEVSVKMLNDSITCFLEEDLGIARAVREMDNVVDGLRDQILRELITFMTADTSTIERSIHLIRISSNLERVADLSTNICEDVVFMVEGRVVKHQKENP